MCKLIRRLIRRPHPQTTIVIVGDPLDVETNSRRRLENARRIVEGMN